MASLSRTDLPEEIATAIEAFRKAEQREARLEPAREPGPWADSVTACRKAKEALTAAILSRLGEAAQGAPFGTGSQASPEAAPHLRLSGVDPSRVGAIHAVAEAWASIDGKMQAFQRERDEGIGYDDPTYTGHYEGYLVEAESLIRRVWRRGFSVVPRQDAQGTEARSAETERLGPKDDGPVAEGHAPALTAALARVETLEWHLRECVNQLEYEHGKFGGTGSGETVLSRARSALSEAPPQGEQ